MVNSVNVLGTEYKVETHKISEDNTLKSNGWSGYCDETLKLIVVADTSEEEYYPNMTDEAKLIMTKEILRHEITHAFLDESGLQSSSLQYSSGWAVNEEMVDWFALQSPKIFKAFKDCECL